jgi:hypothetical protein
MPKKKEVASTTAGDVRRRKPEEDEPKKRQSSNTFESITQTPEERILKTIHDLYTTGPHALCTMANEVGLTGEIFPPR